MATIKNPITIIKVTGGQDEPSSDAKLLSYDRTTGVITGTGLGSTGTLYLLDRDTHSYVAQPTSSWSGTQITLTTPLDLEHLEGSTSIVAVTSAGWSTKLLVKGDVAVSGWAKLYLQNPDTRAIYTITIDNQTDFNKLNGLNNAYARQITIDDTVFYRDEIVGLQLGEDFDLISLGNYFLGYASNFNQPLDLSSVTSVGQYFLQNCYSFNQPLDLSSVTSTGQHFLENCYSFNQSLDLPSVTSISYNFLNGCYSFNQPLDLSSLTSAGAYFLQNCYSFNQPLDLSSLTSTGLNFLENCHSFNQPLDLSSLTSTGAYFLSGCYSFNQPLDLSSVTSTGQHFLENCYSFNQPLDLPSVTSISYNFLSGCYSFNQPLDLPSVTSIGQYFLQNCYSFNQVLSIPASLTSIASYFLFNCYAFSNLVTETTTSPTDSNSLSTTRNTTKMYIKGVTITGAGASTWVTNLPDRTDSPYRKLIDGTA